MAPGECESNIYWRNAMTVNAVATSLGNAKAAAVDDIQGLLDGSIGGTLTTAEKTARLNQDQEILAFVKAAGQTLKDAANSYTQ
jgi:hypothetical protein